MLLASSSSIFIEADITIYRFLHPLPPKLYYIQIELTTDNEANTSPHPISALPLPPAVFLAEKVLLSGGGLSDIEMHRRSQAIEDLSVTGRQAETHQET